MLPGTVKPLGGAPIRLKHSACGTAGGIPFVATITVAAFPAAGLVPRPTRTGKAIRQAAGAYAGSGIRASTMPAYQLDPAGIALSSKS